jgi:hypothetical protein
MGTAMGEERSAPTADDLSDNQLAKKPPLLVRAIGLVGRAAVAMVNHVRRGVS